MKKIYYPHYDNRLVNYYYVDSKGGRISATFQESNRGQCQ